MTTAYCLVARATTPALPGWQGTLAEITLCTSSCLLLRVSRCVIGSTAKQLPIDDALPIAREIADALGSAHKHDVVHRDIWTDAGRAVGPGLPATLFV